MNPSSCIQLALHQVTHVECVWHDYLDRNKFTTNTLTVLRGDAADPVSIVLFGAPGLRIRVTVEQEQPA